MTNQKNQPTEKEKLIEWLDALSAAKNALFDNARYHGNINTTATIDSHCTDLSIHIVNAGKVCEALKIIPDVVPLPYDKDGTLKISFFHKGVQFFSLEPPTPDKSK